MDDERLDQNKEVAEMTNRGLLFALRLASIEWKENHAEAFRQDENGKYVHSRDDTAAQERLNATLNKYDSIQDEILRRMGENI
jgi:hypothetical protein